MWIRILWGHKCRAYTNSNPIKTPRIRDETFESRLLLAFYGQMNTSRKSPATESETSTNLFIYNSDLCSVHYLIHILTEWENKLDNNNRLSETCTFYFKCSLRRLPLSLRENYLDLFRCKNFNNYIKHLIWIMADDQRGNATWTNASRCVEDAIAIGRLLTVAEDVSIL